MDVPPLVVAVAQVAPVPGDVRANAEHAAALIHEAAVRGAQLVVFGELSLVGYDIDALDDEAWWVTERDRRFEPVREAVTATGLNAIVGAPVIADDGRRLLASIAVGPDRQVIQGKHHLHGAERDRFVPDTPGAPLIVDGYRVALAVCADAAVPTHALLAADTGADVYAVSALYTSGQERRLDVHMAARAMDHRMHVVLANLGGTGPSWTSCGGSGFWGPDGERGPSLGVEPGLLVTHLSKAPIRTLRARDAGLLDTSGQAPTPDRSHRP